jgi:hypothetical protein
VNGTVISHVIKRVFENTIDHITIYRAAKRVFGNTIDGTLFYGSFNNGISKYDGWYSNLRLS